LPGSLFSDLYLGDLGVSKAQDISVVMVVTGSLNGEVGSDQFREIL